MTKRILKIISASAAAALALGLTACGDTASPIEEKSDRQRENIKGENKLHLAVNVAESAADYNAAFEKAYDEYYQTALLEREQSDEQGQGQAQLRSPSDVASYTSKLEAHAKCMELGVCETLELDPVQDPDSRIWAGSFEVDSIEDASAYLFTLRNSITCTVGGNTGRMESKPGFSGNYKEASIELTYDDGTVSRESAGCLVSSIEVTAPEKSGTITKTNYEFTVFSGENENTPKYEIIRIELIKK